MRTKILDILVALALGSAATLTAAPFPIEQTRANETRPQVAYDDVHDRYLVVWDTGSGVSGRLLSADGTPMAPSFPILWNRSGEHYAAPSVAFKSHLDRFYVAAIRTDDVRARTDVVLSIFEADGRPVRSFPFQVYSGRWGVNLPANVDIEADSYGTDCCLLVAWEDEASHQVFAALLDERPVVTQGPFAVAGSGPSDPTRYANIASVYRRRYDNYVLVYEENPTGGVNRIGTQVMDGYGGARLLGPVLSTLTTDSADARMVARPRVAYDPDLDVFLLTWFERALARVSAQPLDTDGPYVVPFGPVLAITGPGRALEAGAPVATGAAGHFSVYLPEPLAGGTGAALAVGYRVVVGAGPATVTRRVLSDTYVTARGGAFAAYSPVRDAPLAVWHEFTSTFTTANDVWGAVDDP
jgi:hypothetical protein